MRKQKPIRNLIVISDSHIGCGLGLMHPDGARLDDGGIVFPSKFQKKVYSLWEEFWKEWVPEVTRGEAFAVLHNGDAIDGTHHNSTHQWSHNMEDQVSHAELLLKPIVSACEGRYYHIRGTEAHVGKSAVYEEALAKRLGAIPNSEGQFARYELWKRVGRCLVHCLHHIGTTGSAAYEASAVNAELTAEYVEAARWGDEPPDFVVRSHRHRSIAVDLNSHKGYAAGIVTPGWQGKTPFAWKIPGARLALPQFGGILIRQGDEEFFYRRKVWSIERAKEE